MVVMCNYNILKNVFLSLNILNKNVLFNIAKIIIYDAHFYTIHFNEKPKTAT